MVRLCGNYEDADDALVEALLKAHKASRQLKDDNAFGGWLATIAKRACFRIKRRAALHPLVEISEGDELQSGDAALEMERRLTKLCIDQALQTMPPIYREVYVMRELEGLDTESAARELKLSVPAVKSRHFRARAHLQRALDGSVAFRRS